MKPELATNGRKSPIHCCYVLPFHPRYTSAPLFLPLVNTSSLVPCHLLCISSGSECKALNCICAFLLLPSVLHRAGKTSAGSTAPRCIWKEEVSMFERVLECDLHSVAPQSIGFPSSFQRVVTPCGASSHHQPAVQDINPPPKCYQTGHGPEHKLKEHTFHCLFQELHSFIVISYIIYEEIGKRYSGFQTYK